MKTGAKVRNSVFVTALLIIFVSASLASCGSGGGGGGAFFLPTGVAKGTFIKTFGTAFDVELIPFSSGTFGDVTFQGLYTAAQVGASGKITALRFQYGDSSSAVICPNTTIRLGHSSLSALGTAFAANINVGSANVVLDNATVTIPAGAVATWFEIPLSTPFDYDGINNLVVQIDRTTACSAPFLTNVDGGQWAVSFASDSTPGTADNNITTGSVGPLLPLTQFVFEGGDNRIAITGTAGGNSMPLTNLAANMQRVQTLYLASEINGSGPITGIALQSASVTSSAQTYTCSLKLGHTSLTALTTTSYAANITGSSKTVANGVTFTVPANLPAGEWFWVPIPDDLFTYNGRDNLVVDISVTAATGDVSMSRIDVAGVNRRAYGTVGNTGTLSGADGVALSIKLRFNGGQVLVLPDVAPAHSWHVLGSGSAGQIQSLYPNTMLGTSGRIQNVYVRLSGGAPAAASLTNYKLYMGNTSKTTYSLTDSYASNMDENAKVFSGTLTVPAGLKTGDWVKIPLSSPFSYDSRKNLSILFTTDAGPAGNLVSVGYDSILLPAHSAGRTDNSVTSSGTPGWVDNGIVDLAVDIKK